MEFAGSTQHLPPSGQKVAGRESRRLEDRLCSACYLTLEDERGVDADHKVLTYVEYRAVSDVFQNIDSPPPSPPSECVLPPHQRRGVNTRRAVRGMGGQYLEDASHRIGL